VRAVGLVLALACCAPARPTTPSAVVKADVDRAEKSELARQHDAARAAYERAIADAHDPPSEHFARREYADTLATWGEYAEMRRQLERVVAIDPDDAGAWHDLGMIFHHDGDDPRALAALERAKQLAPRDFRARRELAKLRWALHDFAAATAEFRAALDLPLTERERAAVQWALDQLARPDHGLVPSS